MGSANSPADAPRQSCLPKGQAAHFGDGQPQGAQDAHLTCFFQLQGKQGTQHADKRHQCCDQLHGRGDGEGAVEDDQRFLHAARRWD